MERPRETRRELGKGKERKGSKEQVKYEVHYWKSIVIVVRKEIIRK